MILVRARPRAVPATVLSRCQLVRFAARADDAGACAERVRLAAARHDRTTRVLARLVEHVEGTRWRGWRGARDLFALWRVRHGLLGG